MKQFLLKSLLYSLPILVPIIIFCCFINPYISGDIGPLGYISFPHEYAQAISINNKVQNCSYNYFGYDENDILIIGDSFSQTTKSEISYNYFLAESLDSKVYNLQDWLTNPFNRFIYLSKTRKLPKIVVIESVERGVILRLVDMSINATPLDMIDRHMIDTVMTVGTKKTKTILEKAQEWMKRNLHLKGYENPICHSKLTKPSFSCQGKENDLYFYVDDINRIDQQDSLIEEAVLKLDSLFDYANEIDVDLYVLIAADKYDVYQDYIIDNKYPKQMLLENLTAKFNHPNLINSKDTLSKMVASDVMDVYWCNNTHWSPIGSEAVAKYISNIINTEQKKDIFR